MRLDILNTYSWDETNESIARLFKGQDQAEGDSADGSWRAFSGLAAAVVEIGLGSGIFYSHRKQFGLISGNTWAFEPLIPHLMKENFKQFEIAVDHPESDLVSQVGSETNFVLWAEDHPITAQTYARPKMLKDLSSKKIYSIVVSHFGLAKLFNSGLAKLFTTRSTPIDPYEVRIYSVSSNLALAHLGSRFKAPPLFAHRLDWNAENSVKQIQSASSSFYENEKDVREFELALAQTSVKPFLSPETQRVWDRSLFVLPDQSAEEFLMNQIFKLNIQDDLSSKHDFPLLGEADLISRCYRQPVPELHKWWKPNLTNEQVRGMAILSARWLQDKKNQLKVLNILKELKA